VYSAEATGRGAPYAYEWHISNNGVGWGAPVGTGSSININPANHASGSTVFIRVRVTNTFGGVVFAFFQVLIFGNDRVCPRSVESIASSVDGLKVYPNPTGDYINVVFNVEEDNTPVSIQLFSMTGTRLSATDQVLARGEYTESIPGGSVPSGFLLLKVSVGDKRYNQKIIKK
jgi:hypothetical protein